MRPHEATPTKTRGAEDDLAASASRLRLAITRSARRLRQEGAGDLTPTTAAALATVERHGPLTPSELAAVESVQRPTATRTLNCLEADGLIKRTPDPLDGRSALVAITAAGRDRLRRLRRRKNVFLARRMQELSPDQRRTLDEASEILESLLLSERPARAPARGGEGA
jgi:DNA-binding MarR family transcriptional regulator